MFHPLFDIRQPVPLLFASAVHIGALWVLQLGVRPAPALPPAKEVIAFLVPSRTKPADSLPEPAPPATVTPNPPSRPAELEPPAPAVPEKSPPKPKQVKRPKAKRPKAEPTPASRVPSDQAVQGDVAEPQAAPVPVPADAAPRPAPPSSPAPAAPPAPAPAPVEAPRFDAAYLNNPAPAYPPLSRRMGEEGRVVLRVQVGTSGEAGEVRVHASSGFPRLDEAASAAVRSWRFVPAMQGGKAVAASVLVPLNFRLDQ